MSQNLSYNIKKYFIISKGVLLINYIAHKWDNENQSVIEHLIGTAKLCREFSGGFALEM